MKVLEYLKKHTLQDLTDEFAIKVKDYPELGIAVLNYNQIDSPKYHPIVQECRGLIINTVGLTLVSKTFKRFYNINENENDEFDFGGDFKVCEKADGSLMPVYHFNDSWHVGTRGSAFAEGTTASGLSFKEIFESAVGCDVNTLMTDMDRSFSYVFEMCSVHNKVVKLYKEPKVYLLAIQCLINDKEWDCLFVDNVAIHLGVHRPIRYEFDNIDDVHDSFRDFEPTEEGYVLVDKKRNRIKIKNPTYVDLHHMIGNGEITPKRIVDVVFRGETEEILTYFPEYREFFEPWQRAYDTIVRYINIWDMQLKKQDLSQKDFALDIKDLNFKGVLFSMRKGLTLKESFDRIGSTGKVNLLEIWLD